MREAFSHYFTVFLHPVKSHEFFRKRRRGENLQEEGDLRVPSFIEILCISWVFVIAGAFYSVFSMDFFSSLFVPEGFSKISGMLFEKLTRRIGLFFVLIEVILFPLFMFLYVKIWEIIIGLFSNLYSLQDEEKKGISEVVYLSASTNIFLLIPILGHHLRFFVGLFYIFVGLKKNLNFSVFRSIVITVSPLILAGVLWVLLFLSALFLGIVIFTR